MHSGLLVEQDLVHDRKQYGQEYNLCAPMQCQDHWKGEAGRTKHATFGKSITKSFTQDRASGGGQRHVTHKHLVTNRTYVYSQLGVSHRGVCLQLWRAQRKWTEEQDVIVKKNKTGQESVSRLSHFMLCTQAIISFFFFMRHARNIVVIIQAQSIHKHTKEYCNMHKCTGIKQPPSQTHSHCTTRCKL